TGPLRQPVECRRPMPAGTRTEDPSGAARGPRKASGAALSATTSSADEWHETYERDLGVRCQRHVIVEAHDLLPVAENQEAGVCEGPLRNRGLLFPVEQPSDLEVVAVESRLRIGWLHESVEDRLR